MSLLQRIALAPVWILLAIMALPIVAMVAICKGLDTVSPDGSVPKRASGESVFRFAMRMAAWLVLAGLAIVFVCSMSARYQ